MKDPRGRPTAYNDDLPFLVLDAMSGGMSLTQFAALMGVCRATVYNWASEHVEFKEALDAGRIAFEAHWESKLQNAMHDSSANATLYKLYFTTRVGWSESQTVDHKSSDKSMTPKPALDASKLSSAALEEILNAADQDPS